jgi:predicted nucleic acid-binding protein
LAAERSVAVTNTSPVIALAGVGRLDLLGSLFERLIIPFEVWRELTDKPGAAEPALLLGLPNVRFLPTPLAMLGQPSREILLDLHAGERAAIHLALAYRALVLLDDAEARRTAKQLGLFVKGALGVLVEAKRLGAVSAVRPLVEGMVANGCRFASGLVEEILRGVGEGG